MNKKKEIEEVFDILDKHIALEHKAFTDNIVGEWDAAKAIVEAGYRKADEVRKETAKEIWEDLLGIIVEGYHRPQVNTTISSPFMNGENCAYKVVIVRMKQVLKEKYGVEVDE